MPIKEIELGKLVVDYLHNREWEVYQEVRVFDKTCDIVAINEKFSWAIECKRGNLFKVMAQAKSWLGMASFVSVAVPWSKRSHAEYRLAHEFCQYLGIGLLAINDHDVHEQFRPRFYRHLAHAELDIKRHLFEGQKTYMPAGSRGGYFSPFKQTCESLRWFVRGHPGCSMKEAMAGISHHYSSEITARTAMLQWLHMGKVDGIKIQKEGKRIFLYPVSEKVSEHD